MSSAKMINQANPVLIFLFKTLHLSDQADDFIHVYISSIAASVDLFCHLKKKTKCQIWGCYFGSSF